MVFLYSQGYWIPPYQLPDAFKMLAKGTPLGIPNIIIFAIVVAILVYYFLNYTRTGRDIYAVGSNPDAAQYVGIRKQQIIFLVYVLTGVAAGLAGVLWASRFESSQTNTALGFELQTVAASIIGGRKHQWRRRNRPGGAAGGAGAGHDQQRSYPGANFSLLGAGRPGLAHPGGGCFRYPDHAPCAEE